VAIEGSSKGTPFHRVPLLLLLQLQRCCLALSAHLVLTVGHSHGLLAERALITVAARLLLNVPVIVLAMVDAPRLFAIWALKSRDGQKRRAGRAVVLLVSLQGSR
jgi:hypothetical protein